MNADSRCVVCLIGKAEKLIPAGTPAETKSEYMRKVLKIMYDHCLSHSAPWLMREIDRLHDAYFGNDIDYPALKSKYNKYMLERESGIYERIIKSQDPLAAAIKYACAGNYIDFAALSTVDDTILANLIEKADSENIDEEELSAFKSELSGAKTLVYLLDNCGEILLDKLLIRVIRELYPDIAVTAVVKGGLAHNDAAQEDADETKIAEFCRVLPNGSDLMGTDLSEINGETLEALKCADVIIAKGQANFECVHESGLSPYYLFMCKCDFFQKRFGMKQFGSVFKKEDRIHPII